MAISTPCVRPPSIQVANRTNTPLSLTRKRFSNAKREPCAVDDRYGGNFGCTSDATSVHMNRDSKRTEIVLPA